MNYGKKIEFEGKTYYQPEETEIGVCYSDELAFYSGNGVCYIPTMPFERATPIEIDGEKYYCEDDLALYTRDILDCQCRRTGIDSAVLFERLDGCYPSAILLSMASSDGCVSIL